MPAKFSRFSRLFSKWKRRAAKEEATNIPAPKTNEDDDGAIPGPSSASNMVALAEGELIVSALALGDTLSVAAPSANEPEHTEAKRNIWREAFEKLPSKLREDLEARGMKTDNPDPLNLQIEAFQNEAKLQQARSEERDWKVRIGRHELQVRQLTVSITKWATKIGDVAIKFAPSPGAGVWAVVTFLLQGVDTFDTEKVALLSVVDRVSSAIFRAEVYYEIYTLERTQRADVVQKLHDVMVDLYGCVLELLAKSSDLSSRTAIQFCHAIFDTQKPSGILSQLEEYEQALQKNAEYCEITANAHEDDSLKEYLQEAQLFLKNFEQYMQIIDNYDREQLMEWVSKVRYGRHFDEIEEKRSPETGNWLIEHTHFQDWIKSPSSNILWLQGYPGTGKTFLTSAVVRHFKDNMEAQKNGLAFFFCNHAETERRETLSILQSLVRQLAAPKSNNIAVRKSLREARDRAVKQSSHLGLSECRNQLLESLDLYSTTVIIVDALDEVRSEEIHHLTKELDYIMSQSRDKTVKLFISSRPEEAIRIAYNLSPTITINALDNRADIEKVLIARLETNQNPKVNRRKEEIAESILSNCDNVFLLVDLQIKQILDCKTADAIDYELKNIPNGLSERYDRIYSDIEAHSLLDAQMAKRTLQWVISAPELLTTDEIVCAARMGIENNEIALKSEISPESLLAICENLLMVDSTGRWRFFHLSVRDYLKGKPRFEDEARSHCSQVCFLSLIQTFGSFATLTRSPSPNDYSYPDSADSNFGSGSGDLPANIPQHPFHPTHPCHPAHPFSKNIQMSWPFYASQSKKDDISISSLKSFLGSANKSSISFIRWSIYIFPAERDRSDYRNILNFGEFAALRLGLSKKVYCRKSDISPTTTPLFAVARLGLYDIFCEILRGSGFDISQRNHRRESLLVVAVKSGSLSICKALVCKGASSIKTPFDENDCASALALASSAKSSGGQLDLVRYLVEGAHADVNFLLQDEIHGSALAAAAATARYGGLEIVRYLVEEAHADVNLELQAGKYGSALVAASGFYGSLDIVRYLVEEAHADVNLPLQAGQYGSALAAAATYGGLEIVRYLVEEAHADVNLELQAGEYGSALAAAAAALGYGGLEIVRYLVEEAHADVHLPLQAGQFGSALAAAATTARYGGLERVRYLVEEAHADVNLELQAGKYGSALVAASGSYGSLDIVRYLVEEAHADVNLPLQAGQYGSALAAAATYGGLEIVRYLVKQAHADLNLLLPDGSIVGALLTARLREGNEETVKYLEQKEAELESSIIPYGMLTALIALG